MSDDKPIVAFVGPTASGKTGLATRVAETVGGEIINIDSMQVFRSLAVGSDKPDAETRARVPFHMVDVADVDAPLDAADFAVLAERALAGIRARGAHPICAGGTGLYLRALRFGLIEGPGRDDAVRAVLRHERDDLGQEALFERLCAIDPVTADRIHVNDWVRIERALEYHAITGEPLSSRQRAHGFVDERNPMRVLALARPRERLYERIDRRLDEMWSGGLFEETEWLLEQGCDRATLPLKALGYAHAARVLAAEIDANEGLRLAKRDTRRFAKRQITWFKKVAGVTWIDADLLDQSAAALECLAGAITERASIPSELAAPSP